MTTRIVNIYEIFRRAGLWLSSPSSRIVKPCHPGRFAAAVSGFLGTMEVGGGIILADIESPTGEVFGVIFNPHFKV